MTFALGDVAEDIDHELHLALGVEDGRGQLTGLAETARRMFEHMASEGLRSGDGMVAVTGSLLNPAAATKSACRRAIDDLEGGKRRFKEAQYVDALLGVLNLNRSDVGLHDS